MSSSRHGTESRKWQALVWHIVTEVANVTFAGERGPALFFLSTPPLDMSTTPGTRQRRQHVTPSLVKSETFLFALLVFGLAIYVPYMLKTGKGSSIRYVNTTVPIGGAPDAFTAIPSPVIVPPTPVVVPPLVNVPVAAQPAAVPTERRPAPITYIFPYLFSFGRKVLGWITRLPLFIYRILHTTILRPLYYPVAFVLAVLRPITLLLEIIYAVFLRTPLSILAWFIKEAIYPLFVVLRFSNDDFMEYFLT